MTPHSQVTCDFVSMAIKGAQAVVDGNIPPLNAADEKKSRMYLWNNIFFRWVQKDCNLICCVPEGLLCSSAGSSRTAEINYCWLL